VNHPPIIRRYPDQAKQLEELTAELTALTTETKQKGGRQHGGIAHLDATDQTGRPRIDRRPNCPLTPDQTPTVDSSSAPAPKVIGNVTFGLGRSTGSVSVSPKGGYVDLGQAGDVDGSGPFSYGYWVNPMSGDGSSLSKMDTATTIRDGICSSRADARPHFVNSYPGDALKVVSRTMLPLGKWSHVLITYDGSKKPEGIKIYVDGKLTAQDTETNTLKSSIEPMSPPRSGGEPAIQGFPNRSTTSSCTTGPNFCRGRATRRCSSATPYLRIPSEKRTREQHVALAELYSEENDPAYRRLEKDAKEAKSAKDKLDGESRPLWLCRICQSRATATS